MQGVRYSVSATEVLNGLSNTRNMDVECPLVWASAIRVFADAKFRPTVMDRSSFTAAYAYDGGMTEGYNEATRMVNSFTTTSRGYWQSFRIDAASLYLRVLGAGACTAEIKMSFARFHPQVGWVVSESNFSFEKGLLDKIESRSTMVKGKVP